MGTQNDFDKYLDLLNGKQQDGQSGSEQGQTAPQEPQPEAAKQEAEQAPREQAAANSQQRRHPDQEKQGERIHAQTNPLGIDIPKLSDDLQKNVKAYTTFLTSLQERAKTPEFQEAAARRAECFAPEKEKLFIGYMLLRGYVSEQQARDYLKKVLPHDENTTEADYEPMDLTQFDKNNG